MLRWERPATEGPVPEARGGHTACLVGTDLIIFGGHYYGGDGKFVYLSDTCVLDMTTNMWHKVRTGGDEPAGRYGHSGTALDGRIFVFGGRGANGALYKDMHCLDAETWCWSQVSSTTAGPSARFGHAQCLVGDKLVVFGGWDGRQAFNDLWVFDTGT